MKHIKLFEDLDTDFQKVTLTSEPESDLAWSKIYREWDEHNHPQKDKVITTHQLKNNSMKLKKFENFLENPFTELVKGLNNLLNYELNDDILEVSIESGPDKSKSCPNSLNFMISYNKLNDSFIIENTTSNEKIGEYYLPEAISVINYTYRSYT